MIFSPDSSYLKPLFSKLILFILALLIATSAQAEDFCYEIFDPEIRRKIEEILDIDLPTVNEQVEIVRSLKQQQFSSPDLAYLDTTAAVLEALNSKRWVDSDPLVTEHYYSEYFRKALELDLQEFAGEPYTVGLKAKKLIMGHPRLFRLMINQAFEFSYAYRDQRSISEFYQVFVDRVAVAAIGGNSPILAGVQGISQRSLVLIDVENPSGLSDIDYEVIDQFYNMQVPVGKFGWISVEDPPGSYEAMVNPNLERHLPDLVDGREVTLKKMSIADRDDPVDWISIAMFERLDLLLNQSYRWPLLDDDTDLIDSLNPGSDPVSRHITIEFMNPGVADTWMPPVGVKVRSRAGGQVDIEIQRARELIKLDADPRIQSFNVH